MPNNVIVLNSEPGIQRDGCPYDSRSYIDGQWVRFYNGRPRKIGGYKLIDPGSATIIRTIFNYDNPSLNNQVDTYLGREDSVGYERFNYNGVSESGFVNRTPIDYVANSNNLWNFDVFIDASLNPLIVAHVAANANDSTSNADGFIYYGNANDNFPLTKVQNIPESGPAEDVKVSGGIIFAPPILIVYGNNGQIRWTRPGTINKWNNAADEALTQTIANTKILKMVSTRGSAAPQLLAWTSNSLISLSYTLVNVATDGGSDFQESFTPITVDNKITVMSSNSIVGYANQYFWIGLNQFYFFNGIVQPLPNTMNAQYFFDNVELRSRAKVWGEVVNPTTGGTEIWWHWPKRSTDPNVITQECTDVLIYHVEIKKWSDSSIGRSAGAQIGPFPLPIMADNQINPITNSYPLWMHEFGYDKVINSVHYPIHSHFETHIYDFFESSPANNRLIENLTIEPNFQMTKTRLGGVTHMSVRVHNRFFPSDSIDNNKLQVKGPYLFDNNTQKIDSIYSQGRLVSYRFDSDEVECGYMMGKTLLNYNIGDVSPGGNGRGN